jgi:hypothetical protein
MVIELDDTLPHFVDVQWDSVQTTHGLHVEVFMCKTTVGRGSTRSRLFDSHRERWPLVVPSWLTCVVLLGYFHCKVYIDLSLCDTLGHGVMLVHCCHSIDVSISLCSYEIYDYVDNMTTL